MIALMTTQRAFAYVILAVVIIGIAFVAISQMRQGKAELGSEIELAPNRKEYLPDDELEGPRLNKALWTSFGLLVIVAVALPMYWLAEPGRQDGAIDSFTETFVRRGTEMYEKGAQCVNCHGPEGVGGSAAFVVTDENGQYVSKVNWTAPALNNLMYRFSTSEIRDILTYGRPGSPMPAWGVKGGGPNTDQQIDTVIEYLWTVQLTPEEVQTEVDDAVKSADQGLFDRMMAVREANQGIEDPTSAEYTRLERADELMLGEVLFYLDQTAGTNSYSCARCHVPGASYGKAWEGVSTLAKGRFAYSLVGIEENLTEKQQFALLMTGSEFGKQYGSLGLGSGKMPGFGLNANNLLPDDMRMFGVEGMFSPEQVWSVVTYTRNLSTERPIQEAAAAAATEGDS